MSSSALMAVSTATKLANQAKLSRQEAKAKLEESTRTGVERYWQRLGKSEDDVLERFEYKELVEILEPSSKPVDDGTMDEVSCQSAALKVCIMHLSLLGRARTPAACHFSCPHPCIFAAGGTVHGRIGPQRRGESGPHQSALLPQGEAGA